MGLIGSELGPTLNKVSIIESGLGTKFDKVDIIGHPDSTKRAPSGPNLVEHRARLALSGPNSNQNLTKWALSEPKSGQVGIIRGGSGPKVDSARKVTILCGGVHIFEKSDHIVWEW